MKKKIKIVVCALACVLLLFLGAVGVNEIGFLTDNNNASIDQVSPDSDSTQTNYEKIIKPNVGEDGVIKTPYIDFVFDTAFIDYLYVVHNDETEYVVEFYAIIDNRSKQRLFDIAFGDSTNESVMTISTEEGETPVSTVVYPFSPDDSWTQDEINTILAMQEVLNEILAQMGENEVKPDKIETKTPIVAATESTTKSNTKTDTKTDEKPEIETYIETKTPYCTLNFPVEWEEYLKVKQIKGDVYTVEYYAVLKNRAPVLMFSIIFGGDDGEQLGALKDTNGQYVSVNLVLETFEKLNYSDKEMKIIREMQDGVNTLIDQIPFV